MQHSVNGFNDPGTPGPGPDDGDPKPEGGDDGPKPDDDDGKKSSATSETDPLE